MVTPRVEASPDRSDFAKLGETKQFADDIRSQVAEKSCELAEMKADGLRRFAAGRASQVPRER